MGTAPKYKYLSAVGTAPNKYKYLSAVGTALNYKYPWAVGTAIEISRLRAYDILRAHAKLVSVLSDLGRSEAERVWLSMRDRDGNTKAHACVWSENAT